MKEIRQIIQAYKQAFEEGKKCVLATVVHIEGSSYRAPGARMLVTEEGALTGAISGGCLEGDILRKALMVMATNKPLLVTYDTSEEDGNIITVNLGCNGIIRVLLEPIREGDSHNPIKLLEKAVGKRHKAVLVTFFSTEEKKNPNQGTKLLFTPTGIHAEKGKLPLDFSDIEPDIQNTWKQKHSKFIQYPRMEATRGFNAFLEYIEPSPSLVIVGAGNDVYPLVEIGETLGWEITIVDGRPKYANENRFPTCQLVLTEPSEAISKLSIDERTAFVLMSHNYDYDKAVLKTIIHSPVKYIGLLGPTKKRDRILEELVQEGIQLPDDTEVPANLFAPTGLQIGAETSEEIALSIISEIQAAFTDNEGGSLRNLKGHIHHRKMGMVLSQKAYGVLLLAAGESKRLGSPKQAAPYKGSTLLQHAVNQAASLKTALTLAVISEGDKIVKALVEKTNAEIVQNPDYKEGMASSIRTGVGYIKQQFPQVEYLIVMLCDQPYVESAHLQTLIDTQQKTGKKIVASLYEGRKGVPALFHKSLFPELEKLQGDTGAKNLIEGLGSEVVSVAFPLAAFDVDTQEAKERL